MEMETTAVRIVTGAMSAILVELGIPFPVQAEFCQIVLVHNLSQRPSETSSRLGPPSDFALAIMDLVGPAANMLGRQPLEARLASLFTNASEKAQRVWQEDPAGFARIIRVLMAGLSAETVLPLAPAASE